MYAAIINLRSTSHPHFSSVLQEGLWGFPYNSINLHRWTLLKPDTPLLLYFEHQGKRGVWLLARLISKNKSKNPVKYWVENPTGFPLHIKFRLEAPIEYLPKPLNPFNLEWLNSINPILREELAHNFSVKIFRAPQDRWSIYLFGDKGEKGVTYDIKLYENIINEFHLRNKILDIRSPRHKDLVEIVYNMGQLQGKYPYKEEPINGNRIDVVWRKVSRKDAAPYIAFEIHIKGDLYADLVKLKHAYDIWNAIPVLILPRKKIDQAKRWIEGSFHEIAENFKIVPIEEIVKFYEKKREVKDIERKLGII